MSPMSPQRPCTYYGCTNLTNGYRCSKHTTKITIVCGPPGSGKSTYVKERFNRGDLLLDVDLLYVAMSGLPFRDKPDELLPFVISARDAVIERLQKSSDVLCAWIVTTADELTVVQLARKLNAEIIPMNISESERQERIKNDPTRVGVSNSHAKEGGGLASLGRRRL